MAGERGLFLMPPLASASPLQDVATGSVTVLLRTAAGQRQLRELQAAAGSQGLVATVDVQVGMKAQNLQGGGAST